MSKLFVRVAPRKTDVEHFYRCAMLFTKSWTTVEVDDATAARLAEEQMLETSVDQPDDYDPAALETAVNDAVANGFSGDAAGDAAGEVVAGDAIDPGEVVAGESSGAGDVPPAAPAKPAKAKK